MNLEEAALFGRLRSTRARFERARERLEAWGRPDYVSWSGGKDSGVVVHMVRDLWPDVPIVLFDSGLEFPETLPFCDAVCDKFGWSDFFVIEATPSALEWLEAAGTWDLDRPGGAVPCTLFDALIGFPSKAAHAEWGPTMAWGLRAEESPARHMTLATSRGRRVRRDGTVTLAPIWDWSRADVLAYHALHGVPLNPVYARLAELGCPVDQQRLCLMVEGHAVRNGRMRWLRQGWPAEFARLSQRLPLLADLA